MYLPREAFPNLPISVFPNEGTTLRRTETTLFTPKAVMLSEEAMAGITPAPPGGRCQQMAAAFWESPRSVAHSPGAEGGAETAPGPHPTTPTSRSPWRKMLNPAWSPNSALKQIVRELWMAGAERGTPCSAQVCLFLHLNKGKRLATKNLFVPQAAHGVSVEPGWRWWLMSQPGGCGFSPTHR